MVHIKVLLQKTLPMMLLQCAYLRRKDLKCWLLSPFQRILACIVCFKLHFTEYLSIVRTVLVVLSLYGGHSGEGSVIMIMTTYTLL